MSSIEKLAIQGIRSFDTGEPQVISFFHPLTVIVGHNGSGKTTIIETLKYVTTGDMPPNTKGGAFVHDPNLTGSSTSQACVKLRFTNVNKQKMVVTRRLQVSKKKTGGGLTLKTLEGSLSFANNQSDNNRKTLSTKSGELTDEVPSLLGVSRAILDNVIFCHQEDSNWPLADSSTVKKKFDDIFEATRYTKALASMKDLRKEQVAELKVDNERLKALKVDRERAKKIRKTIDALRQDIGSKKQEYVELEETIKEYDTRMRKMQEQSLEFRTTCINASNLVNNIRKCDDRIKALRDGMEESKLSEAELDMEIATFDEKVNDLKQAVDSKVNQARTEEERLDDFRRELSRKQSELGGLKASVNELERLVKARQELIYDIANAQNIGGFGGEINDARVEAFTKQLNDLYREQAASLESVRAEAQKLEGQLSSEIAKLNAEKSSSGQATASIDQTIRGHNQRLETLRQQLSRIEVSEASITNAEADLVRLKAEAETSRAELATLSQDKELQCQNRISNAEAEREQRMEEMSALNRQGHIRAQLEVKRKDAIETQKSMDKECCTEDFRRILGQDPVIDSMKDDVKRKSESRRRETNEAERQLTTASRQTQQLDAQVEGLRKKIRLAEQDAEGHDQTIKALLARCPASDTLADAIRETLAEIEEHRDVVAASAHMGTYLERAITKGREKHKCTTCERGLSDAELIGFEARINGWLARLPDQARESQRLLPGYENLLNELRAGESVLKQRDDLIKNTIPNDRTTLADNEKKLEEARAKQKDLEVKVKDLREQDGVLLKLANAASKLEDLARRLFAAEADVRRCEGDLQSTGSTKTSEDVQLQLSTLADEIKAAQAEMKQLRKDRSVKSDASALAQRKVNDAEVNIARMKTSLSQRQGLEARIKETEADLEAAKEQLRALRASMNNFDEPIARKQSELRALKADHAGTERSARESLQSLKSSIDSLRFSTDNVKTKARSANESAIHDCETRIKDVELQIKQSNETLRRFRKNIDDLNKEIASSALKKRNLDDNKAFRNEKATKAGYVRDYEALDVKAAEVAVKRSDEQMAAARREVNDFEGQYKMLSGEIKTKEHNLKERDEELKTEFADIEARYKSQLIKVKIADFTNEDLEKYSKALESAILRFHEHKMSEINDSLATLWTKCYRGTDIDTIKIMADADGGTGARKTYNYRVVMSKDKVDLDMRGRCSAGQKVLACILIRLALAESFGVSCGFLTLDEPTTNLDRDNIEALAGALREIIDERRSQANFQLVIITHDEDLLQQLTDHVDKYWRVDRNNRQKSTLERVALNG